MTPAFSLYLDVVRFTAACLVYMFHANSRLLVQDVLPASQYGHSSVIVFFVLSGFVIAFITETKENTWPEYASSRISRVYSVVIPALLLTPILDAVGRSLHPALYNYPWDHFALRLMGCALQLNETWFVSITYLSNVPYWSVAFEFWYYVLFSLVVFLPQRRGWWVALGVLFLLGPKIALLLPVWAAGVGLYRWRWLQRCSRDFSWTLVVTSTLGIVLTHRWGVYESWTEFTQTWLGTRLFTDLTFARFFLGDYLLCALVFMHFVGMRNVADAYAPLLRPFAQPIRAVAAYTFTLYLLHQPFFLFWGAVIRGDSSGYSYWWAVTLLTAASVALVGRFTENKRHTLRKLLNRQFATLFRRWPGRAFKPVPGG